MCEEQFYTAQQLLQIIFEIDPKKELEKIAAMLIAYRLNSKLRAQIKKQQTQEEAGKILRKRVYQIIIAHRDQKVVGRVQVIGSGKKRRCACNCNTLDCGKKECKIGRQYQINGLYI